MRLFQSTPAVRNATSNISTLRKWGRRAFVGASVIGVSFAVTDYSTSRSLSRSLRAVQTSAYIAYLYKITSPTTSDEYSNLHRTAAEAILQLCLRNEGLYIKLGQGLNALNHILPREYMEVLKVLLDNAPSVPIQEIRRIIEEETGRTVEELFLHFDPVPIASASVAQVHHAWLRPSSPEDTPVEVAVKVQKPNIRYQVFWDLETYRLVTTVIGALFELPVGWSRQTVMDSIRRETDFSIEASNAQRIRHDMAGNQDVYVPKVYNELVSRRLLVMEWIDAVKLIDVDGIRQHFDEVVVLRTVFDAFGDMIFKFGFVHCDPHAANILVRPPPLSTTTPPPPTPPPPPPSSLSSSSSSLLMPSSREKKHHGEEKIVKCKKPQVVLIDFGLCCPETERFRVEYALLFKSIISQDMTTIKRILTSWGIADAEMFASIQLQKPYGSFRRGNRGEVTPEEVRQMQLAAHQRAKTLLANQEQVPRELPMVGRSIDILRGLNRLYGAPLNRVNMFVRRAVAGLGSIHNYEAAQQYLKLIDPSNPTSQSEKKAISVESGVRGVFDPKSEERRKEQAIQVTIFRQRRDASYWHRLREAVESVYRLMLFEILLFLLDARHKLVRQYNALLDMCLPAKTAAIMRGESLEDLLEHKELRLMRHPVQNSAN